MGRKPCCDKVGLKKGKWAADEDQILINYILAHGEGSWRTLPKNAGLLRCGKSCRLRWINYLRSDLKRGKISKEEEELIIKLHATQGNRWSLIAGHLPGRTDNEIKNYWNSHLSRRLLPSPVSDKTKSTSSSSVGNLPPSDQVVEDSMRRSGPIGPNTRKKKQKSATTAPPSPDMFTSCILEDPMMMVSDNISSVGTSTTTEIDSESGQIHDVVSWLWDVDDIGSGGMDGGMAGDMIAWLLS